MARKNNTQIIDDALEKNPDIPAGMLSRSLYAKHPATWPSLNACYCAVRRRLGVQGVKSRTHGDSKFRREKRTADANWKEWLPDPLTSFKSVWEPLRIEGEHRTLLLSDIHIPFYSREALIPAIQYGVDHGADTIILNGDILDCYQLSRWEKNPELRHFPDEVRDGRMFLASLRDAFPDARIVWKWGNHEERYEAWMRIHPELYGLDVLEWKNIFNFDHLDIEHLAEKRPIMLGKIAVIHGHEYGSGFTDPVSPARTFFLKSGVNVIGGHYHRTSQHSKGSLSQTVISAWSTGCLCELHPAYRPLNEWNHGFAFVETSESGAFNIENLRLFKGSVWR